MPLVQRQSPEQIESRSRHKSRRAVIGLAAFFTGLLGISTATTGLAVHKVNQGQEILQDYLLPNEIQKNSVYHHVSQRQPENDWPPVSFSLSDDIEPAEAPGSGHEILWAAGTVSGSVVVSFGVLTLLGAARRRNGDPEESEEIDYETTDEYALYDFELRQMIDEQRMHDGLDQLEAGCTDLETRLAAAEQKATAGLIAARLGLGANNQQEPVNLAHIRVLDQMGENPLGALNYSCPDTFYTSLDMGESVGESCQPIWPELQHA